MKTGKSVPLSRKPRAVDLFSGCGGLTLGLKDAGFQVVGAIELDPGAASTYRSNHPDVLLAEGDIREVSSHQFRVALGLLPGELELLAGCPPCQGFSTLRTRNGAHRNRDVRNGLMREMIRFAREFQPKAIMMENVPRLMQHSSFIKFCRELRRLGYVLEYDVKDAAAFGVPQRRRRLILLGGKGLSIKLAKEGRRRRTVRGAIGRLSPPGRSRDYLQNMPEKKRSSRIAALIRDIPKDGGGRRDLPTNRQLPCHIKSDGFSDVYGRMVWNEVAPTITSGCFNPSKGRFLHPEQNRPITMREAALLQSFPKNYSFPISLGKQAIALLIGNALPPEFVRRHAIQIARALRAE
jgi:DNA (cytosine-5)-methyltransferase 1